MQALLDWCNQNQGIISVAIFLISVTSGIVSYGIKKIYKKENSKENYFIKAGGDISAGGDIIIGNTNAKKTEEIDKEILKFYAQVFDRPAFQESFHIEGNMGDFDKAIEDTITAINTGVLKDRSGKILVKSKGKKYLKNNGYEREMSKIVSILREIRNRYNFAILNKEIRNDGFYILENCTELCEFMDIKRRRILNIFEKLCKKETVDVHYPRFFQTRVNYNKYKIKKSN